ncbi:unnamed protein product [Linum trigynum]|uniref:Lysine-specific demethylase JMJ16 n=1 Tax=Linum trigynum TaxID=586398 RepID=A0AAV2EVJ8_9ROSI
MGTELMRVCVKEENEEVPAVPPGFESFAPFSLKRIEDGGKRGSPDGVSCIDVARTSGLQSVQVKPEPCTIDTAAEHVSRIAVSTSASTSVSGSQSIQVKTEPLNSDANKITKSLRRKPWINHGHSDRCTDDDPGGVDVNLNPDIRTCLPKGVVRGCPQCKDCQKVTARWRPEYAHRPDLEEAPVFYPTEEEFEDTLNYIASIRLKAEPYGICRIVPPPSWKPPCPLKEKSIWEGSKFITRVQRVDKLQNRGSMKKLSKFNNHSRKKRRICMRMPLDCGPDVGSKSESGDTSAVGLAETFGFDPGPEFDLSTFQKYADDFKAQYFRKDADLANKSSFVNWEPTVENVEGEYWRIIEKATEEIEVLYGADLETGVFGSGFPKMSGEVGSAVQDQYSKSGWNLNNFPRLSGSVLSYESGDITGVLVPWLYIGMCFSSFCWHVEDHHLYSLNYLHWGAPKMWYGVPGKDAVKLEEAMRKHLPDLFDEQPDLLHKLVTQLSPSILKSEGVPVYRCAQNAGEFVLTFPRAYHAGFNSGFNCAEAVNVAPVDWLPHGQIAVELYRDQGRRTSISHDKLLLGAAREAVKAQWQLNLLKRNTADNLRWKEVCGKDGILAKALKTRLEMERTRRAILCKSSQTLKMASNFDATCERECTFCLFDLHLSAAGCRCSPDRYTCLNHANQLCSCAPGARYFLFRYEISELDILVEALEGKLSAVYRWARSDLGLALTSPAAGRKNIQDGKVSHFPEASLLVKGMNSQSAKDFVKETKEKGISNDVTLASARILGDSTSDHQQRLPETVSGKDVKASSASCSPQAMEKGVIRLTLRKRPSILSTEANMSIPGLTTQEVSCPVDVSGKSEARKSSNLVHDEVIFLSDDEGVTPKKEVLERAKGKEDFRTKHSDLSDKLSCSGDSPCNDHDYPNAAAAPVVRKGSICSSSNNSQSLSSAAVTVKEEESHQSPGAVLESYNQPNSCLIGSSTTGFGRGIVDSLHSSETTCNGDNIGDAGSRQPNQYSHGKSSYEDRMMGISATSSPMDLTKTTTVSPSCLQSNLDRCLRQKGPRIAKVVRRINCNVEPQEFGVVLSGNTWCNSQAIFPKGYRSRVKYISVLDPTSMCYYVSEILDSGRNGPLFMVSLEQCPAEVFVHISATRCWEMVRERVNQEITKQYKMGKPNLAPLQPPGSLDGFEMFGFSSPTIVQAIEALDHDRVCTEYWDSRPYSRPQGQIPRHSLSQASQKPSNGGADGEVDEILRGVFKKADPEELSKLNRLLNQMTAPTADNRDLLTKLVNEEIQNRSNGR